MKDFNCQSSTNKKFIYNSRPPTKNLEILKVTNTPKQTSWMMTDKKSVIKSSTVSANPMATPSSIECIERASTRIYAPQPNSLDCKEMVLEM